MWYWWYNDKSDGCLMVCIKFLFLPYIISFQFLIWAFKLIVYVGYYMIKLIFLILCAIVALIVQSIEKIANKRKQQKNAVYTPQFNIAKPYTKSVEHDSRAVRTGVFHNRIATHNVVSEPLSNFNVDSFARECNRYTEIQERKSLERQAKIEKLRRDCVDSNALDYVDILNHPHSYQNKAIVLHGTISLITSSRNKISHEIQVLDLKNNMWVTNAYGDIPFKVNDEYVFYGYIRGLSYIDTVIDIDVSLPEFNTEYYYRQKPLFTKK